MKRSLVIGLCTSVLGLFPTMVAQAQAKLGPDLQTVLAQDASTDTVRIVVEFTVPEFAAAKTSIDPYAADMTLQQRRDRVAAARATLLSSNAFQKASGPRGRLSISDIAGGQNTLKTFSYTPVIAFEVQAGDIADLRDNPLIQSIRLDGLAQAHLSESTSLIGMPSVWSRGYQAQGQAVAILDDGLDTSHSFFANRIASEACYSSNTSVSASLCPNSNDYEIGTGASANCTGTNACTHGTHVTGIAAGNGTSYDGVARAANIISIQVFAQFDETYDNDVLAWSSDILSGLERVLTLSESMNIAAVNMSLGGGSYTDPCTDSVYENVSQLLTQAGIAVISSAGNGGNSDAMGSPACTPSIISVGATHDGTDEVTGFSDAAYFLDLLAPGTPITSAYPGESYATYAGTSMSAPHVAGAFAVLRAAYPTATINELLLTLKQTGTTITDFRSSRAYPRINMAAAVETLEAAQSDLTYVIAPIGVGYTIIPVKKE